MIAVKLEGRLGNQLFQYAFIYSAAKKLNTRFYLDKSIDYLLLAKHFNIERDFCSFLDDNIFSIKGFKNIFSHYLRWGYYYLLKQIFSLKEITYSYSQLPSTQLTYVKNKFIYAGYFQSEQYFELYRDEIKNQFTIKSDHRKKHNALVSDLPNALCYVVVHVRRGDYVTFNYSLPVSYYHNAIKSIHADGNYYIFISDDTDFVKSEFGYLSDKYVSENDEITDLQFLINADICLLSNSSFSWWGAWLNNRNAKIIAPKYWLGNIDQGEEPLCVIPNGWIRY